MNNILVSLKRFIKNKNTVTVLGVIVALGLLYWGYTSQINKAVNPVRIPIAKTTIQPRQEITSDMIEYVSVPAVSVKKNVIRAAGNIIGKYSNVNSVIPAGSMFYNDVLVAKEQLPDSAFSEVKEGEIPYQFSVNMESTFGNSIFPGNKIDIYMKAIDDNGQVMVGKLLENVEVLAVKDSQGRHVFENTSETRTPAYLIFGVPEDIHLLLRRGNYLKNIGVELFPVPHGGQGVQEGEMQVSIEELKTYIDAHSKGFIPSDGNMNGDLTDPGDNLFPDLGDDVPTPQS